MLFRGSLAFFQGWGMHHEVFFRKLISEAFSGGLF